MSKPIAGIGMALASMVLLSACQRTVESNLPAGPAAYQAIAVPAEVAAPQTYTLRSGDRIDVAVFQEPDFSTQKTLVDASGNIVLPTLGTLHVAGMTQDELASTIRARLASSFLRDPRVTVMIDTPAVQTVSVEGEVDQPGVFEIAPGHTLLTALALARSPTDTAKLDEVLIFRTVNGQRMGARFDVAAIRAGAAADPAVLPGDVVVVGFSRVRGVFKDFLTMAPLFNIFTQF